MVQNETIDPLLMCGLTGGARPLGRGPGPGQDPDGQSACLGVPVEIRAHPVHSEPDALRYHRIRIAAREGPDESAKMVFRPGPVFAILVLADEINRAAPKISRPPVPRVVAAYAVLLCGSSRPADPRDDRL